MEVQTTTTPKTVEECCVCSAPVGIEGTGQEKTRKIFHTSKMLEFHRVGGFVSLKKYFRYFC